MNAISLHKHINAEMYPEELGRGCFLANDLKIIFSRVTISFERVDDRDEFH